MYFLGWKKIRIFKSKYDIEICPVDDILDNIYIKQ